MALLFSKVTMTGDGYETEFLVGGIPREYEDLEGWVASDVSSGLETFVQKPFS